MRFYSKTKNKISKDKLQVFIYVYVLVLFVVVAVNTQKTKIFYFRVNDMLKDLYKSRWSLKKYMSSSH